MKRKRKLKYGFLFTVILLFVFLGLFLFSSYKIICYLIDREENHKIKEKMEESVVVTIDEENKGKKTYTIDFETLKKDNPDTVAYLEVTGTNINYIVVQGNDNDYYLNHNFNKKWNVAGWIFVDYHNRLDGTDQNIVVYGHAIQDGSMFGSLKKTLDKEWQENANNHELVFITEQESATYQVFSTYMIDPEMYYINTTFASEEDYWNFLKKLQERSNFDYKVSLDSKDTILTLSSCNATGSKRVVLHAKKMINNIENN